MAPIGHVSQEEVLEVYGLNDEIAIQSAYCRA